MSAQKKQLPAIAILSFFLIFRLALDSILWRKISPYYSYFFEFVIVCLTWSFYRKRKVLSIIGAGEFLLTLLISSGLGGFVYYLADFSGIKVPFNVKDSETVFLLLILAPILEEFIFRMALWEALRDLMKDTTVLISSTVLFSFGHLMAVWNVPLEYRTFVAFQSLYVIILGLAAGWRRMASHSVLSSVTVHFGFNFGFFLMAVYI